MRRNALTILSIVISMSAVVYGQSLGDVARESREKQKAKAASSAVKPKVITNETLPKNPDAESFEIEGKMELAPAKIPAGGQPGGQSAERQSAEQWKSRILAQKNAVANLQAQIDKVSDSIHFVTASAYYNGVQYNQRQVKKQENVAQMQQQLEGQKKNLAAMQEAARSAGMGSAVYDP
jgi:ABC-type antimicrobial peptide transport system permease subunit